MTNNNSLEKLYKDIFELVYPLIKDEKAGILYKVIHILLELEKSEADQICADIGIKENALLDDDENIFAHLIEKPNVVLPIANNWLKEKLRNFINPDMTKITWIVVIGCLLVGVTYCKSYINNQRQKLQSNQKQPLANPAPQGSILPVKAALCLVVPASTFIELKNKHPNGFTDNNLNISDLKILIDNASYFSSTTVKDANLKEELLEKTNEEIPTNSDREVYIRIDVSNGQEIIDKNVIYIVKRNLPTQGQRIIQRYFCLKNLSGLEQFNRV